MSDEPIIKYAIPPDRIHPVVYPITSITFRIFYRLGGFRMYGVENFPKTGRVIIAPNHVSHLDPPLVSVHCPRTPHIIAKRELFKKPWFGRYLANLGAFPVSRGRADRKALRRAMEVLENDLPLIIFPEGTRSKNGELQPPEMGLGHIAQATKSPILPVFHKGAEQALSAVRPGFRLVKTELHFGKLLNFEEEFGDNASRQEIGERVMREIAALRDAANAKS